MSNRIVLDSTPGPGWSPHVDRPSTKALHAKFAALNGRIDKAQMRIAFAKCGSLLNVFTAPLSDSYLPFMGGTFAAGRGAKIAIAFPHCADDGEDGTSTDRSVSVHTMREVDLDVLDELVERLAAALPSADPPPSVAPGELDHMSYADK